jgi:hypothetical protein
MGSGTNDPYGGAQPGWPPAQPGQPGPQGWGPPPPGYGTPPGFGAPPGYAYSPPTDSKAITALVLAIVSFALCPIIPAIVALVLVSQSNRAIAASGGRLGGTGMNTASKVISWINIVVYGIGVVVVIGVLATAGSQISHIESDFGHTLCSAGPYYTPPSEC